MISVQIVPSSLFIKTQRLQSPVSVLLYGLEVCPLTKADMQSLDFCVNRILMKLFVTKNISIVDECRHFFNFELPSELLLCKRTAKFLHKLHARCD